jgi:predicted TIM-barrel fold metal-dependent hydrolase
MADVGDSGGRIDAHAHQIPRRFLEEVEALTGRRYPLPEFTTEAHLAEMDAHGIELAIVFLPPPGVDLGDAAAAPRLARLVNEHYAGLIDDHPGRFAALASLPLPDVDAALEELPHALDVLGLDGVVLLSNAGGMYAGDERMEPLLAELDRRGAYVHLHPADPQALPLPRFPSWLIEYPFETTRAVATLLYGGALHRYPRIRWHLPHLGGTVPFLADRIGTLVLREPQAAAQAGGDPATLLRGLFLDTAQSHNDAALAATQRVADAERIVFGTDWPFAVLADGPDPQPGLDALGDRAAVDRGNALRMVPSLARRLGTRR